MTPKALVIPDDIRLAPHLVEIDHVNVLPALVFGDRYPERDELAFSFFRKHRFQLCYDDMGLLRPEISRLNEAGDLIAVASTESPMINPIAMALWADLAGRDIRDFGQPLVGTYVGLGLAEDGETIDIPEEIVEKVQQMYLALAQGGES